MQTATASVVRPTVLRAPRSAQTDSRLLDTDQIIVRSGVTWSTYVALRQAMDTPGLRMAFDQGVLEIMSPSRKHEVLKKMIGRLVEVFCLDRNIALQAYGSMTMRSDLEERGLEPDECYCAGDSDDDTRRPDFAIEVVLTHQGMDKLPIYASLGVREVWYWCDGAFALFELVDGQYRPLGATQLVPGLELEVLARFVARNDQSAAVGEFRRAVAGR